MIDSFGATLARLRCQRRLSQAELGRRAGFNHSAISRHESDLRNPERETVDALATALQLDDGEHARLLMSAGFLPADYREVLEQWAGLSDVALTSVLAIMRVDAQGRAEA